VALALWLPGAAQASPPGRGAVPVPERPAVLLAREDWADEDRSYDRARRASERGEILPLSEVLAQVRERSPGRVLEAELEREHGLWVYELKILDPAGRLLEVSVDARTGQPLGREED
jgi:uncharacterized membrane protein YkoI